MIGNDMKLDTGVGTCGKNGQSVPVGVGQPTFRLDGLTVGGTRSLMPRYWFRQKHSATAPRPTPGRAGCSRWPARSCCGAGIRRRFRAPTIRSGCCLIAVGLPAVLIPFVLYHAMSRPKAAGAGDGAGDD